MTPSAAPVPRGRGFATLALAALALVALLGLSSFSPKLQRSLVTQSVIDTTSSWGKWLLNYDEDGDESDEDEEETVDLEDESMAAEAIERLQRLTGRNASSATLDDLLGDENSTVVLLTDGSNNTTDDTAESPITEDPDSSLQVDNAESVEPAEESEASNVDSKASPSKLNVAASRQKSRRSSPSRRVKPTRAKQPPIEASTLATESVPDNAAVEAAADESELPGAAASGRGAVTFGLGTDIEPKCVTMPQRLKILVAALPPAVYSSSSHLTGGETLDEMIQAMWRYAAAPSDKKKEPFKLIPLARRVALKDAEKAVLIRPKPGLSNAAILKRREDGARGPLEAAVYVAPRRMEALRRLTSTGLEATAAAVLAGLRRQLQRRLQIATDAVILQKAANRASGGRLLRELRREGVKRGTQRATADVRAEAAADVTSSTCPLPPFTSPLRYQFSTQTWRDLERVITQRVMESPYSSIVDMRNVSDEELASADAVFIPWPVSHMRGRKMMGPFMKLVCKTYVPSLWTAPKMHVFTFARIMRDADRLPSLAANFRQIVRMKPYKDARYISFEPYYGRTLPKSQLIVPYVGAVRRERSEVAVSGLADGAAIASFLRDRDASSSKQSHYSSTVNGQPGLLPSWHPADPWFARRAVLGRPLEGAIAAADGAGGVADNTAARGAAAVASGRRARGLATNASDSSHSLHVSGHDFSDWGAQLYAHGVAAFRRLSSSSSDDGSGPDALGWYPWSQEANDTMQCDPLLFDEETGKRKDGADVTCSRSQKMAALHVERPLFVSFIGAPRQNMGERVATIRGLKSCPNCGVFDVRGDGPFSDGLAMAWVYSHSIFCAQPHGDSPTRKGFFDALLFGCIPVVLDSKDPATKGRAPFLPFGWAIPWRDMTALLSRREWMSHMVQSLRDKYGPGDIRRMQATLASVAHLAQSSLPSSDLGSPPPRGPKDRSARDAGSGWARRGKRCAEDAFDLVTVALAR